VAFLRLGYGIIKTNKGVYMQDLLKEAFDCVYEIERLLSQVSARIEEGGNIAYQWPNVISSGFTGG
jgi:hypothetical protein